MSAVFLKLLNLSITASWLILAVILVRFLLKKAPKWIPCVLWALVAVRLVCPFSLESALSLIPSSETIPSNIEMMQKPAIDSGITAINEAVNPAISHSFAPDPMTSANPLQIIIPVLSIVWIVGMAVMLLYALISYIRLKKSVGASVPVRDNILACDDIQSPFILGIIKPVVYLPSSLVGDTLENVLTHESAHIRRHDHWWKPLGYLLLTVYWFNPLCWLAYILLCRDIEMACDEKVIRDMDNSAKAAYSQALLNCSFPRKRIAACPLAFGEVGVKERVKSVLNYKKPALWIIIVAVAACIVVGVCFMTNPKDNEPDLSFLNYENAISTLADMTDVDAIYYPVTGTVDNEAISTVAPPETPDSSVGDVDEPISATTNIRTDVCELYLEVLEDLWNVDSGLNGGISQIGIDLSGLTHLTEAEKESVMNVFATRHNLPYIAGTWEELCEQGYIDKDNLYWEDGLFFSIKTTEADDSFLDFTTFDAHKWRSGLGAYFFNQCTARKKLDGKWSYTVGAEMIS